jgi:hypothetical protein
LREDANSLITLSVDLWMTRPNVESNYDPYLDFDYELKDFDEHSLNYLAVYHNGKIKLIHTLNGNYSYRINLEEGKN